MTLRRNPHKTPRRKSNKRGCLTRPLVLLRFGNQCVGGHFHLGECEPAAAEDYEGSTDMVDGARSSNLRSIPADVAGAVDGAYLLNLKIIACKGSSTRSIA